MVPRRLLPIPAALAALVLAFGCASSPSAPTTTTGGVTYELPHESQALHVGGGNVRFRSGDLDFRVHDRAIILNSVPYGAVRKGDHVRLTADGRVFVNDVERRAGS